VSIWDNAISTSRYHPLAIWMRHYSELHLWLEVISCRLAMRPEPVRQPMVRSIFHRFR